MEIITKFNLGNEIYALKWKDKSENIICETCKGTGFLSEYEINCPKCEGRGYNTRSYQKLEIEKGIVQNISIRIGERNYSGKDIDILYNIDMTSFYHYEEDCFSSRKEAREVLKKMKKIERDK